MNIGTFSYVQLQYHHSQILGEVLNVGLFVYFPEHNQLQFIYPEKLIRLRSAYPEVQTKSIKSYLKYFESRVNELNLSPEIFAQYDLAESFLDFLHVEFLQNDSSALQLSQLKKSVMYSNSIKTITDQLYNLYFSVFKQQKNVPGRIDESILIVKYKKILNEINLKSSKLDHNQALKFDFKINENFGAPLNFEVAWHDKRILHLIKPISFDLQNSELIQNKAYRFYGQFVDLDNYATANSIQFDVLLAKPKIKSLFVTYDNALKLLSKPSNVDVIEFDNINTYAQITADLAIFNN